MVYVLYVDACVLCAFSCRFMCRFLLRAQRHTLVVSSEVGWSKSHAHMIFLKLKSVSLFDEEGGTLQ